jgi:NAD(P)-dependent dehydrogenase (short-subunit alcohol dehydrogenase family)
MGVVIVTGGAGVLGSAVARQRVAAGDRVALVEVARSKPRLDALHAELGAASLPIILENQDFASALGKAEAAFGPVTGAVLTAGGWAAGIDSWKAMMASNADSAAEALGALLPGMVARKNGSIVLIGSRAALRPETSAGAAAYAAAKAAVVALCQAVAADVRDSLVRVNAVLPSTIDTPANRTSMPNEDFSRWVAPTSLAEVIGFLLSDASRDVSGVALPVYGRA